MEDKVLLLEVLKDRRKKYPVGSTFVFDPNIPGVKPVDESRVLLELEKAIEKVRNSPDVIAIDSINLT